MKNVSMFCVHLEYMYYGHLACMYIYVMAIWYIFLPPFGNLHSGHMVYFPLFGTLCQ
jgi:hypothetical protein